TPFITAIIPAHNEADGIEETIHGLFSQTVMPDRILVVSDNSTDETGALVRGMGVAVMETVDNQSKKAGALNQALRDLLPDLAADDLIVIQDADSVLAPDFIERAIGHLKADEKLGAVGGVFSGGAGGGFVGHLQRNEYARYARDVTRRKG